MLLKNARESACRVHCACSGRSDWSQKRVPFRATLLEARPRALGGTTQDAGGGGARYHQASIFCG
jgi:hypothetical protein